MCEEWDKHFLTNHFLYLICRPLSYWFINPVLYSVYKKVLNLKSDLLWWLFLMLSKIISCLDNGLKWIVIVTIFVRMFKKARSVQFQFKNNMKCSPQTDLQHNIKLIIRKIVHFVLFILMLQVRVICLSENCLG